MASSSAAAVLLALAAASYWTLPWDETTDIEPGPDRCSELRAATTPCSSESTPAAAADPGHDEDYRRDLARLERRLDELDAELRRKLRPLAGRSFLVFRPSWGYFAAEYGLRQLAIEHDGNEPSDSEITELQRLARREDLRVVFVQPQIPGRSARAVASALGGRTGALGPLARDVAGNLRRTADLLIATSR